MKLSLLVQRWRADAARITSNQTKKQAFGNAYADELEAALAASPTSFDEYWEATGSPIKSGGERSVAKAAWEAALTAFGTKPTYERMADLYGISQHDPVNCRECAPEPEDALADELTMRAQSLRNNEGYRYRTFGSNDAEVADTCERAAAALRAVSQPTREQVAALKKDPRNELMWDATTKFGEKIAWNYAIDAALAVFGKSP